MKIKKTIVVIILLLFFCLPPLPVFSQKSNELNLSSEAAVLMEAYSGQVLFSKNAGKLMAPASLTKLMTLLLGLEAIEKEEASWDEKVLISEKAWLTGGSQMFLDEGQQVPLKQLLQGIGTISANDACVAIAEHLFGSEAQFITEMNRRAEEIGMENTRFQNSSGLDAEDQYTTAMDIAILSHHLIKHYPVALELLAETSFTFNEIDQFSRNPLLGSYPGADGLKTGYTSKAGYNLAATAQREEMRFITVTLNAPSAPGRLADTESLLNYAFDNYRLQTVVIEGEVVTEAALQKGQEEKVPALAAADLKILLPQGEEDIERKVKLNPDITAPVTKGQPLGSLQILCQEDVLGEVEIVAGEDVMTISGLASFWRILQQVVNDLWTGMVDTFKNIFS